MPIIPRLLTSLLLCPIAVWCQDGGDHGTLTRGSRVEISVSVRDSSGRMINAPSTVTLYQNGMPSAQASASHGRAFLVPPGLGDFTLVVEAAGYKVAQKDVSFQVPVKAEVDIYLQPETLNMTTGVPGGPVLAPKAREELTKGTQAMREDKLAEAQKHLQQAVKLAPGHPEVLYMQGMLYMRQRKWPEAQSVLEKSNQIEPNQPRVLAALGMALCNQKKYDEATAPLEQALQREPAAGWETEWALAKAYYYRERYEDALKMAEQSHAASRTPNSQVELLLAQCLTAVGRYEDSAAVLRELLKATPSGQDAATAQRWLERLAADGKIHR